MNIKGKQIIFFFIAVFIGMILTGMHFIVQSSLDDFNDKILNVDKMENKQEEDSTILNDELSISNSKDSEEVVNSVGGGGASDSSEKSDLNCKLEPITYSIIDQKTNQTCQSMNGEICVEKTINCTATIENRDTAVSNFEIELYFIENGQNKENKLKNNIQKFSLTAGGKFIFKDGLYLTSTDVDGIANKNINCFYISLKFPMKEICS